MSTNVEKIEYLFISDNPDTEMTLGVILHSNGATVGQVKGTQKLGIFDKTFSGTVKGHEVFIVGGANVDVQGHMSGIVEVSYPNIVYNEEIHICYSVDSNHSGHGMIELGKDAPISCTVKRVG